MKIAVLSDIHSNYTALTSALDDLGKVDVLFFLGDYISDGYQDNEVVDCVRMYGDCVIAGNRDLLEDRDLTGVNMQPLQWTLKNLREDNRAYLKSLPQELIVSYEGIRFLLLHGDVPPLDKPYYPSFDALIEQYEFDVCLTGHIHRYFDITYRGKRFVNASSVGLPDDGPFYKYLTITIDKGIAIQCHTIDVADTYETLKESYCLSSYYQNNPVWGKLVLDSIRLGKNMHEDFLPIMVNEMKENRLENVWENTYAIFQKRHL